MILGSVGKAGLEYKVKGVEIDTNGKRHEAYSMIKQMCEKMNESRWELSSMSWPQLYYAVLVFTRPMKR